MIRRVFGVGQIRWYAGPVVRRAPVTKESKQALLDERQKRLAKKKIQKSNRIATFKSISDDRLKNSRTGLVSPLFLVGSNVTTLPQFSAVPEMLNKSALLSSSSDNSSPRRWFGMPRNVLLEHRLFREPMTLIREVTVAVAQLLDDAKSHSSESNRFVLTGPAGCGKTFLLMQAVEHAHQHGYIVIYIPRVESFVNSSQPYQYDLRTRTYLQPSLSRQLINRIIALPSNLELMKDMVTTRPFIIEGGVTGRKEWLRGASLIEILRTGAGLSATTPGTMTGIVPESSALTFDFLLTELATQSRVPILLAIDGIQSLFQPTLYRSPQFEKVQPWHMQVPRMILEALGGKRQFANGVVLSSLSFSDPCFPVPPVLANSLALSPVPGAVPPLSYPHDKTAKELYEYVNGIKSLQVPDSMNLEEASQLFEIWMGTKVGDDTGASDSHFLSKYTESSGNPRNFVWKGLLASLEGNTPLPDLTAPWPQLKSLV